MDDFTKIKMNGTPVAAAPLKSVNVSSQVKLFGQSSLSGIQNFALSSTMIKSPLNLITHSSVTAPNNTKIVGSAAVSTHANIRNNYISSSAISSEDSRVKHIVMPKDNLPITPTMQKVVLQASTGAGSGQTQRFIISNKDSSPMKVTAVKSMLVRSEPVPSVEAGGISDDNEQGDVNRQPTILRKRPTDSPGRIKTLHSTEGGIGEFGSPRKRARKQQLQPELRYDIHHRRGLVASAILQPNHLLPVLHHQHSHSTANIISLSTMAAPVSTVTTLTFTKPIQQQASVTSLQHEQNKLDTMLSVSPSLEVCLDGVEQMVETETVVHGDPTVMSSSDLMLTSSTPPQPSSPTQACSSPVAAFSLAASFSPTLDNNSNINVNVHSPTEPASDVNHSTEELRDSDGVRWGIGASSLRTRARMTWGCRWKPRHAHFERRQDMRPREERRATIRELTSGRQTSCVVRGWRLHLLQGTSMQLVEEEEEKLMSRVTTVRHDFEARHLAPRRFNSEHAHALSELAHGIYQRSQLIMQQLQEARETAELLLRNHRATALALLDKHHPHPNISSMDIKKEDIS